MSSVIVYTTPTCGFCHMLKNYLGMQKVEFEEKDITTNADAYQEVLDMTGQLGVPVMQVDDTFVIGFDRTKVDLILRDKKLI